MPTYLLLMLCECCLPDVRAGGEGGPLAVASNESPYVEYVVEAPARRFERTKRREMKTQKILNNDGLHHFAILPRLAR